MRVFALLSALLVVQTPLYASAQANTPQAPPAAESSARPVDCDMPYAAFGNEPVVVKDFAEMVEKLEAENAGGNLCAQFELGMMYINGVGVEKNADQGMGLLRQAADRGHADAQHTLGLMYTHGRNVDRDVEQAVEWYYKAGLSYLERDNRRLALREIDYISRERPGHGYIEQLKAAIHEHWLDAQRMSKN